MIKKLFALSAAFMLAAGVQAADVYKDGTYVGEGQGKSSIIKVEVKVADGKIADVKILEHGDTPFKVASVEKGMLPQIVEKNGLEGVEAVAGASFSSRGVKTAVEAALAQAK